MINKKMLLAGLLLVTSVGVAYAATIPSINPEQHQRSITRVDTRDVVYSAKSGTVVRSTSGACVRTQWSNNYDMCTTEVALPRVERPATASRARAEQTVYFAFNQTSLSSEMKARLDALATRLKVDRNVRGARIVGYADRIGDPVYNEKLSKRRAESARRYLAAKGVINTEVADTRWLGESAPVTDCSGEMTRPELIECLQPDRRVEVEIDYNPNMPASY
ncbi:MAG: OmpA family protein [Alphaproteobacteria bacterium]|nr:OmpA family protein [Alphaproteobacteria bacterium]